MDVNCKNEYRKLQSCFVGHNFEGFWYRSECQELKDKLAECLKKNKKVYFKKESRD